MLKFLFRNDRGAAKRVKRRLSSPRASVFLEFALIAPILIMFVSAMIELVGFWDSQIMANHAAWQVGRIAMVRGADGMAFTNDLSHVSSTGVISTDMPKLLSNALGDWTRKTAGDLNKFNDRGIITTAFLMMTCEMGYFGKTPNASFQDVLKQLFTDPMKELGKNLPGLISKMIIAEIKLPSFKIPIININLAELMEKIINPILQKPLEYIGDNLAKLIEKLVEKLNIDLEGEDAGSLLGREFFATARRIAVNDKTNIVNVVQLKDTQHHRYSFNKTYPLDFPQAVTSGAEANKKVPAKNVVKWPVKNNEYNMIHTKISWPYSRGWLFPVVSGYQTSAESISNSTTRAVGHSLVLPSPNIVNANLFSSGATTYPEGTYTNLFENTFEDVTADMQTFAKQYKYIYEYRIHEETFTTVECLGSLNMGIIFIGYGVFLDPWLKDIFGPNKIEETKKGKEVVQTLSSLYINNWKALTGLDRGIYWSSKDDKKYKQFWDPVYYRGTEYLRWPEDKYKTGYRYDKEYDYLHKEYDDSVSILPDKEYENLHKRKSMTGCDSLNTGVCGVKTAYREIESAIEPSYRGYVRAFNGEAGLQEYDEAYTYTTNLEVKCQFYYEEHIYKLVKKSINDLARMASGQEFVGDDIIPADVTEYQDDPQKALKEAQEKLKTLKSDAAEAWIKLNDAVKELQDARAQYIQDVRQLTREGGNIKVYLGECAHKAAVAFIPSDYAAEWIGENCEDKYAVLSAMRTIKADVDKMSECMSKCHELEIALGKLLGIGSAQREPEELDPNDIDPGSSREIIIPTGDLNSGSDDDTLGDKWIYDEKSKKWKKAD